MIHKVEFELGGRTMIIESGRMAKQSNGAVTVQYGDSMVISTVCSSPEPRIGFDFFPLTIEYRERSYAAGKIPGGFFKREGRPSEKEILSARIIDRPIRPLFPDDFRGETQCINFIISHDQVNDTDVMALVGTGAALAISDVPTSKTVAGVRVGRIDGEFVVNPEMNRMDECDLYITIAGSTDAIAMVEGGGREISEAEVIKALEFGHQHIKTILENVEKLCQMCGKETFEYTPVTRNEEIVKLVTEKIGDKMDEFNRIVDKETRNKAKKEYRNELIDSFIKEYPDDVDDMKSVFHDMDSASARNLILNDGIRIDGRGPDDIRDLDCQVGVLPRTHGSGLFTRGQTQALATVTLGTKADEQRLDELDGESTKSYMLHYNFPPFCTGETKPIRGTNRREIGHGALAERALFPVIPSEEGFPYTIRVVSDVMESNGSSSMASVCGGTLALLDAGVPIKAPVAGIAMGLIKGDNNVAILTDILGDEDHFGDMDFKVTGTAEGITAIQMDIKIDGLDIDTMHKALEKAKIARLTILDKIVATLPKHREQLSDYAPRIITVKIPPSKIGDVIGPGGKMIRSIVEETGAKIDISDDGTVLIASVDSEAGRKALERVQSLTEQAEVGKVYSGTVRRVTNFGAFVEIIPGTDGLLHISEIDHSRIERVEDVLNLGDRVDVKVLNIDGDGKIRLSRKALLEGGGGDDNKGRGGHERARRR